MDCCYSHSFCVYCALHWITMRTAVTFFLGVLAGIMCYIASTPNIDSPVYITANHINSDSLRGVTKLYGDDEYDVAYYRKNGYVYKIPNKGTKVKYAGGTGVVDVALDDMRFYVIPAEESEVYKGLSGTRVKTILGEEIAFISSYVDGKLVCVSIK